MVGCRGDSRPRCREIIENPREVEGTTRCFLRFPNATTVDVECELLCGFKTMVGTPARDGTPYEVDKAKRVSD